MVPVSAFVKNFAAKPFVCGTCLSCLLLIVPASAAELWVSPDGSDHAPGLREKPFATAAAALRQARELRRLEGFPRTNRCALSCAAAFTDWPAAIFAPGRFRHGTSPTIIEAATNEQPVFSGGVLIAGWKMPDEKISGLPEAARGQVWVADAPKFGGRILEFRQLWVNDHKAIRAREPNGDTLNRLVAWDKTKQEAEDSGVGAGAASQNPAQLEMVIDQVWEIAVLRVKSMRIRGRPRARRRSSSRKAKLNSGIRGRR